MENDVGLTDNFVNALKFSFSNVKSLAIWGISYVVAMAIFIVLFVVALIFFGDSLFLVIVISALALLPVLVLCVLLMGFVSQCLKTVLNGGDVMPTGLESPGDLVKDGVMTSIILLEAVVLEFACLAPGYLLVFLAGPGNSALILAAMALMLLAIPVILVIFFLNVIQWAVYADTGSLLQGLNPLRPIGLVISNPMAAGVAVLSLIGASVVFSLIMLVCELLIITILLLPFLIMAEYGCTMYLVAVYYRQVSGDRPGEVRDQVTGRYSVS